MSIKPFSLFFKNLRYLCKYNLKDFNTYISNLDNISKRIKHETKAEWDEIIVPKIKDSFSTLYELKDTNKSFIRFGDGEFTIIEGRDIPFQYYDERLKLKLLEILKNNYNSLLIGLSWEYYHSVDNTRDFPKRALYTSIPNLYKIISKMIEPQKIYYSATISQVYALYKNYDFDKHFSLMREIWNNKPVTVVTGDRVLNNIEHNILDNAKKINYIYGPTMHAYKNFDELKKSIEKVDKDNILIFALGPCGKALAYDLYLSGYRVLDLGHAIKDYNEYKNGTAMTNRQVVKFFEPD